MTMWLLLLCLQAGGMSGSQVAVVQFVSLPVEEED